MRKRSTEGRRLLDELLHSESGWDELWRRLTLYTYGNFGRKVEGRFDLDTVIQDAIEDTYFGTRQLPPDVELTFFLCGVIRSKVSHLLEKERQQNLSFEEMEPTHQQVHFTKPFGLPEKRPQFAEGSVEAYQDAAYREFCVRITKSVGADANLRRVAALLFATPDLKPGEIAERMNLPVKSILNLLKRLSRSARKIKRG